MNTTSRLILSVCIILFLCPLMVHGQVDSLILNNGNTLVGEIKSMENSVLVMETPFSKSDFTIKWGEIKEIYTTSNFLITLENGTWYQSNLNSAAPGTISIRGEGDVPMDVIAEDIVYLKEIKSGVWSRMNLNIDLGLDLTKANNQRQFTIQSSVGYLSQRFGADIYLDNYQTRQDSVASIKRREGGANVKYFLDDDWYIMPQVGYLSNTEQALKARFSPTLGLGRYLTRNNRYYWGVLGGISMNIEKFTNDTEDRQSTELFFATGVNFFEFGDLDLLANAIVYPSLTEKGRVRSDAKVNLKYEFLDDFYIKFYLNYNYDNQPAISGNESDYVFGVSFGWEKG